MPTYYQAGLLRQIAQSPMMMTRVPGEEIRFSLQNGKTIPRHTAEVLIRSGWVKGDADGMFGDTQTYRVLTP